MFFLLDFVLWLTQLKQLQFQTWKSGQRIIIRVSGYVPRFSAPDLAKTATLSVADPKDWSIAACPPLPQDIDDIDDTLNLMSCIHGHWVPMFRRLKGFCESKGQRDQIRIVGHSWTKCWFRMVSTCFGGLKVSRRNPPSTSTFVSGIDISRLGHAKKCANRTAVCYTP